MYWLVSAKFPTEIFQALNTTHVHNHQGVRNWPYQPWWDFQRALNTPVPETEEAPEYENHLPGGEHFEIRNLPGVDRVRCGTWILHPRLPRPEPYWLLQMKEFVDLKNYWTHVRVLEGCLRDLDFAQPLSYPRGWGEWADLLDGLVWPIYTVLVLGLIVIGWRGP
jgi:hypothetical protein